MKVFRQNFCNVFLCIVDIFIVAAKQTSPKQQLDKLYLHGLSFCKLPFWTASNRPLFFIQSHRLVSIHTFFYPYRLTFVYLLFLLFPLKTVDEKFIEEEKRFRTIEKTVKTMLKNISAYLEDFKVI